MKAILQSDHMRENAPLFGVTAILICVFVMLALFGKHNDPALASPTTQRDSIELTEIRPASAEEDGTILSILDPANAQARNAATPFADKNPAAAPAFIFHGSGDDRERARDCLALAAMAEAGVGNADQRSVMQVVLNRTRHPAFAGTVCGVVFEGSQRPTGCQFTFTCDGSLSRNYSESMWRAARARAEDALGGYVHKPVGTATHYHANYVYPYWSDKLDKIAVVGPHLFFRWRGYSGTPRALSSRYKGGEPDPMALSERAQKVERPEDFLPRLIQQGTAVRTITATGMRDHLVNTTPETSHNTPASDAPGVHFVLISEQDSPAVLIERARALCPGDRFCQVYGWDDAGAIPTQLPLNDKSRQSLRFSFLPARNGNAEAAYFDCRTFPAPSVGHCLPRARP